MIGRVAVYYSAAIDWYRNGEARIVTLAYYANLRAVIKSTEGARSHLIRCFRCRIFFLTDPRNKKRKDISCPFGCRDIQRLQLGNARSRKYNETDHGKISKSIHNSERKEKVLEANADPQIIVEEKKPQPILKYLTIVLKITEGRWYSKKYIWAMISEILRQRSIDKWGFSEYLFARSTDPPV